MKQAALSLADRQELHTAASGLLKQHAAPGIALAAWKGGDCEVAAAGTRDGREASLTEDSLFPLGCLIKPLLALVCLELHVNGRLDIDEPVGEFLPVLGQDRHSGSHISLRHLLSHTAGYVEPKEPNARWKLDWDGFADKFKQRRQPFSPGTVWSYTQTGHAIIARIIERVVGHPPIDLIRSMLLEPLGVDIAENGSKLQRASGVVPHIWYEKSGRFEPARLPQGTDLFAYSISDLSVNIRDLAVLARALGGKGLPSSISRPAFSLFASAAASTAGSAGGTNREVAPSAFGLGLAHFGRAVGHNGSFVGTTCAVRYDEQADVAVAVAFNGWNPILRDYAARTLLKRISGNADHLQLPICRPNSSMLNMVGHYRSLMLGLGDADIVQDGLDIALCMASPIGEPMRVSLSLNDEHVLIARNAPPWMALTIDDRDSDKDAHLMVGPTAYCKVDGN